MKLKNFSFLLIVLAFFSCKTRTAEDKSSINYMQNIEQAAIETSEKNAYSTLQPGDQLLINISAPDMDVVRPFNQNYSSAEMATQTATGNSTVQAQPVVGPSYVVDADGNIDFPHLGKINTTGKTIDDFKQELQNKLTRYIKEPTVSVRLTNYKITVMGEVTRPNQYLIPEGKTTLLNALGLAGDLTMYGKRNDILVVRNEGGEIQKGRVDITDASFINSPFYNLKQGDVIYVSSNKNREIAARQNPNTPLYISVASVALGVLGIIVSVLKK